MTYNVFGGTLSLTQSVNQSETVVKMKQPFVFLHSSYRS